MSVYVLHPTVNSPAKTRNTISSRQRIESVTLSIKMGMYDEEVKNRITQTVWNRIIEEARRGRIDSSKMGDIAALLKGGDSVIRGNHYRRGRQSDGDEMREILSDWWNEELHELSQSEAIAKLSRIFSDRLVQLNALAKDIRKVNSECLQANHVNVHLTTPTMASSSPLERLTLKEVLSNEISKDGRSGKG